jgi:hypothetical protein
MQLRSDYVEVADEIESCGQVNMRLLQGKSGTSYTPLLSAGIYAHTFVIGNQQTRAAWLFGLLAVSLLFGCRAACVLPRCLHTALLHMLREIDIMGDPHFTSNWCHVISPYSMS